MYIHDVKYVEINTTNFVSFNGFTLPSDEKLKSTIEDVEEETIDIVKHVKLKTFVKKGNTKTEIGYVAQQLQKNVPDKYDVVNTSGEYLTVSYEKTGVITLNALQKLINRVEYLENEVLKLKSK